jgi:hypothetical protein
VSDIYAAVQALPNFGGQRVISVQQSGSVLNLTADEARELATDLESCADELEDLEAMDQLRVGLPVTFKCKGWRLYGTVAEMGHAMVTVKFTEEYANGHGWLRGQTELSMVRASDVTPMEAGGE